MIDDRVSISDFGMRNSEKRQMISAIFGGHNLPYCNEFLQHQGSMSLP
ncbi:hypothetical protein D1AOALGA4SA_9121 [Olavius algarvensis Delta 1 endosymbiont]|nr:hypothetical protein D1AOALGA4SA_9121 [Olavius algarvensis Delta 1 endosymbiont]